jgi:beta-glucosidase
MPVKLEGFSGGDRTAIDLPADQEELLKALAGTGKPLIVVLQNGSALAVNWANEHADAVLEAWYPGEEGGTAIAETLAGDNNPAGRLPLTFYRSLDQLPAFDDYAMQGRTYRYFAGKPLYSFGYGLSYTTFAYRNLKLASSSLAAGDSPRVEADVENTGAVAGDEVVEVYVTQPKGFETPRRVLAGFTRVHLAPHATTHVSLTVDPRSLGQVDAKGNRVIVPGEYSISAGSAQPEDSTQVLTANFRVTGTKQLDK